MGSISHGLKDSTDLVLWFKRWLVPKFEKTMESSQGPDNSPVMTSTALVWCSKKGLPQNFDFQSCANEALVPTDDSSKLYPILHKVCSIEVRWISSPEGCVSDILACARQLSQAISESKTTSVRKDTFNQPGSSAKQYILSIHRDARTCRPDTTGTLVTLVPNRKIVAAKKEYVTKQGDMRPDASVEDIKKKSISIIWLLVL